MKSEIGVARALGAVFVQRMVRLFTIIGLIASAIALLLIWALAQFVSGWWWLLLIIYIPLVLAFILLRLAVSFLAKRIYRQRINKRQTKSLNGFIDTVQGLLEARVMGWPVFVLTSVKDLLFYKELRSLKKLIHDTSGLRKEFDALKVSLDATD